MSLNETPCAWTLAPKHLVYRSTSELPRLTETEACTGFPSVYLYSH